MIPTPHITPYPRQLKHLWAFLPRHMGHFQFGSTAAPLLGANAMTPFPWQDSHVVTFLPLHFWHTCFLILCTVRPFRSVSTLPPSPSFSSTIRSRRTFFRITADRTVVMVSAVDPVRMAVPTSKDPAVVATYKNTGRMAQWTSRLTSGSNENRNWDCLSILQSRTSDTNRFCWDAFRVRLHRDVWESYRSKSETIAMVHRELMDGWK